MGTRKTDPFSPPFKPLRVMHIVGRLNYGGIETIIRDFAKRFPRDRILQTVCCILPGEGSLSGEVRREGVSVHVLPYSSRRLITFVSHLSALIRKERIDIVHSHIFYSTLWMSVASLLGGARGFVSTIHSSYHLSKLKRFEFRLMNVVSNLLIDRNVCISSAALRHAQKHFGLRKDSFEIIRNGIDVSIFCGGNDHASLFADLGIHSGAFKIGTVGSLRAVKNQLLFIRALARAIESGVDAYGIIVGEGPLRRHLEDAAKALQIADRVVFAGTRNDVPIILSGLDIFVLSSRNEGLPIAVLEAMSSRLPVILTAFETATEILENGKHGFIVPMDDAEAMAKSIQFLYLNPEARKRIGNAARRRVEEHFELTRMIDEYERLYRKIAGTGE